MVISGDREEKTPNLKGAGGRVKQSFHFRRSSGTRAEWGVRVKSRPSEAVLTLFRASVASAASARFRADRLR